MVPAFVFWLVGQAAPVTPETTDMLRAGGPYLAALISTLGAVMGYGAMKSKVDGWDRVRKEDNDVHDAAELRLANDLKDLEDAFNTSLRRQREDYDRALDMLRQADAKNEGAINGLGGRVNKLDREIGEVRGSALTAVDEQRKRIDLHSKGSEAQQVQNAEFYAREAKTAAERIEGLLRSHLEKAEGNAP